MSAIQLAGVLRALNARSEASTSRGGDGFVSTSSLTLTIGLNTRTVRRVLDRAVDAGEVIRRPCGRGYSYCPAG